MVKRPIAALQSLIGQVVSHLRLESPLKNCLGQQLKQPVIPENFFWGLILFEQIIDNGEVNGHVNSLGYIGVPLKGDLHKPFYTLSAADTLSTYSEKSPSLSLWQLATGYLEFQRGLRRPKEAPETPEGSPEVEGGSPGISEGSPEIERGSPGILEGSPEIERGLPEIP
jgi:hypothetical protein